MSAPSRRTGRGWAYVGVVLGGTVSVAANVAASFIPPDDAAPGWVPPVGGVVSAVCWPVLLLVAVEVLARVAWPGGWRWWLLRAAGLLPVALIAAVVSYRHGSRLLAWYGEDPVTATLGPLAVDGLMVMATGALLANRAATHDQSIPAAEADHDGSPRLEVRPVLPRTPPGTQTPLGGAKSAQRSDAELIDALQRLEKNPDGTVPVRRAAKELGTGPDRARRLLSQAGLLRTHPTTRGRTGFSTPGTQRPTPPTPPTPVRVPDPPVPAVIDVQESDVR